MKEKEPDPKGSGISPSGKSGEPLKPNPQKSGSFPSINSGGGTLRLSAKPTDKSGLASGEGNPLAEGPSQAAPPFVSLKEIESARSVLAFLSWPMPQRLALALERAMAAISVLNPDHPLIKEFYDRP